MFSDEELNIFKLVKSYYNDFIYSEFYSIIYKNNKKMFFDGQDNTLIKDYMSYNVVYFPDEKVINYYFDQGTAYRGFGSYYIIDENIVIKIQKSIGTSAYGYQIFKNGNIIDESTIEYDYNKK